VKGSVRLRKWLSLALCAVGIGLLAYWAAVTIDAYLFQRQLTQRLETTISPDSVASDSLSSVPEVASSTRREADTSGLIGRFEIPRLGISAMVTEGVTRQALGRGIGHVPGTAFPGERGNVGLAAHRDTYFRRLKGVAQGDRVRLDTPDGVFSYEVEWAQVVNPDRVDLLRDTGRRALTLVTCYPFNWVGSAPQRFVVRCRAIGEEEETVAPNPILGGTAPEEGTDPMDSRGASTLPE
jgi:sortase A